MAKEVGCDPETIRTWMKRYDIKRRSLKEINSGPNHPQWKGGRRIDGGYYIIWTTNGYRYEHIKIVEKSIGRKLEKDEHIHHIDGDKLNNNLNNLFLYKGNQSEHIKLHHQLEQIAFDLFRKGYIKFNKEIGEYYADN